MTTRTAPLFLLLAASAACSGKDGKDGSSTGRATGTVSSASGDPVAGASILFSPGDFEATSRADGTYAAVLPAGVYSAVASVAGLLPGSASGISVVVGQETVQDFTLAQAPPAVSASAGADRFQAGFGAPVQLDASASSAPPGASYAWQQLSGPAVTLSDPTAVRPTFTTLTLAELETAGLFAAPARTGMVGFSAREADQLTYLFEVAVSSGAVTSTARVSIQSVPAQPGLPVTGVGALAVAGTRPGTSYAWTCAVVQGAAEVPCAAGVLGEAGGRAATFLPGAAGEYVLRETVGGSELRVTAAGYVGPRPIAGAPVSACGVCHVSDVVAGDGRTLTDKFTPWSATRHASFFRRAIDGALPVPYEPSCIRCHTTGFNPEAANGGFDDVAAAVGWVFPTPTPGQFDALARQSERLASLAAVSCESCHGPGSGHASAGGAPAAIARGFNADTCAQCHAKEPYEVQGLQWVNSRHASFVTGAVPAGGDPALLAGCTSCHSARGFVGWTRSGNAAQVAAPRDLAEPQTCVACHDPHGEAADPSGQPTFRQLRVYEDVTTASGVGVKGVGAGAICLRCHNRRVTFSASAQLAPHFGAEGDVLLAKGAEVFSPPLQAPYPTSAHGGVPQLCVGCHMAPTPPPGSPGHNQLGGHSVALTAGGLEHLAACGGCHAGLTRFNRTAYGDYDGNGTVEGVQDEIDGLLGLVAAALDSRAAALWPTETGGAATVSSASGVIRVLRVPELTPAFADGAIPAVTAEQQDFLRAAWNLSLVRSDRSLGIHNTAYTVAVLQRTYQALTGNPVPGATLR